MYRITICQSVSYASSIVQARTLTCLEVDEIPDNLDDIVDEYGGDFYHIEDLENDMHNES